MSKATLRQYRMYMQDIPAKFDQEEVGYRKAEDEERCGKCFHYYTHVVDGKGACEVVHGENIRDDFVCNFYTKSGHEFPLLRREDGEFSWNRKQRQV